MLLSDLKIVNGKVVLKDPIEEFLHNVLNAKTRRTEAKNKNFDFPSEMEFIKGFERAKKNG